MSKEMNVDRELDKKVYATELELKVAELDRKLKELDDRLNTWMSETIEPQV